MKRNKYIFVCIMLLAIAVAGGIFTTAYVKLEEEEGMKDTLQVVTSFYPIYIAAENVIDENPNVTLQNLSEPQTGCMHDYQLTPQDMILLSKADVFIVNGGGIESFLTEVAEQYPNLTIIKATEGLELLKEEENSQEEPHLHEEGEEHDHEEVHNHEAGQAHGEENAHAWMNTRLYAGMIENIAKGLTQVDSGNKELYQKNAARYGEKIQKLTDQITELKGEFSGKDVILFHEAYEYVAQQYGMNAVYCLDLDEERQVSAGEVARVMKEIKDNQVSVILAEELYGKDMGDTVEREGACRVYYLDSLVRGAYNKDSYLNAMQKNIDLMREVTGKE